MSAPRIVTLALGGSLSDAEKSLLSFLRRELLALAGEVPAAAEGDRLLAALRGLAIDDSKGCHLSSRSHGCTKNKRPLA